MKINFAIKRRILREMSGECRKKNMMGKKKEIPNAIWEVLIKNNKQFSVSNCLYVTKRKAHENNIF